MSDTQHPQENDTTEKEYTAISLRDVKLVTWKRFKKLAALRETTLQEMLEYLVDKEADLANSNKINI
jgi:macrodomain Ter protein organizer (MatP/YcbG family)